MSPHIEQNRKTDVIVATGRATYRSAKADMIADKVTIYRKESRAEFSGNVVMLVRAKKDWDKPLPKDDGGLKPLSVDLPPDVAKSLPTEISPARNCATRICARARRSETINEPEGGRHHLLVQEG